MTDLYLASHHDSNSPFAAILSQAAARHQHERRLAILEMFRLIAEKAARLKYPPLPGAGVVIVTQVDCTFSGLLPGFGVPHAR